MHLYLLASVIYKLLSPSLYYIRQKAYNLYATLLLLLDTNGVPRPYLVFFLGKNIESIIKIYWKYKTP